MRHCVAFGLLSVALLASAGDALPDDQRPDDQSAVDGKRTSAPNAWPFGKSGPLRAALTTELERSLRELRLVGLPDPYYIGSTLVDSETVQVTAMLGAISQQKRSRSRRLDVDLRVGDYQFDNSGFVGNEQAQPTPIEVAWDADSIELRRSAWLAIDSAFKQAASNYESKRAARATRAAAEVSEPSSFSKNTKVRSVKEHVFSLDASDSYARLARELSSVFREFAFIQSSGVALSATTSRRILVTTEGTEIVEPGRHVSLIAWATTQAEDGMWLSRHHSVDALELSELPKQVELRASLQALAETLGRLRHAPVVRNYTGPILFEGQAAGQLLERLLRDQLSGTPAPEMPGGYRPEQSSWSSRLGLRVFPGGFTLVDDPTLTTLQGHRLTSGYEFDDEGVRAERVELVENGYLKQLLMSRTPSKDFSVSNGHARRHHLGMLGRPSTLVLQKSRGLTRPQLHRALLQHVRQEQLSHGFVVRQLEEPITAMLAGAVGIRTGGEGTRGVVGAPVLMFKVLPSGAEELVRGASIDGLEVEDLGDILTATQSLNLHRSLTPSWGALATPHPPSFVAPDLLIRKADVRRPSTPHPKPPVMQRPLSREQQPAAVD